MSMPPYEPGSPGHDQPYPPYRHPFPPPPGAVYKPGSSRKRLSGPARMLLVVTVVVIAVVGLLGTLWVLGGGGPGRVFDEHVMEADVRALLADDFALSATSVDCPGPQPVEQSTTFECVAVIDDAQHRVTVTVLDERTATYEVGRPER